MLIVYHHSRCKKSRACIKYLTEKNVEFQVVDYLKKPFDSESLDKILIKLNIKPHELIRTHEPVFKKNFRNKVFSEHEWIQIMIENPTLIKRPIIEAKYKAIIGDTEGNINEMILQK